MRADLVRDPALVGEDLLVAFIRRAYRRGLAIREAELRGGAVVVQGGDLRAAELQGGVVVRLVAAEPSGAPAGKVGLGD